MKELLEKWYHKKVYVMLGGLKVSCVVMDIKERWGKTRFLISPERGTGEVWVESIIGLN